MQPRWSFQSGHIWTALEDCLKDMCTSDAVPGRELFPSAAAATVTKSRNMAGMRSLLPFGASSCRTMLNASLWTLSGTRLVCHCRANERCHGDFLVEEFRRSYPAAYDREDCHGPPPARALNFAARPREEPESDDGSSPDEGVPGKFAGHRGTGKPMQVGVGYVQRDLCDGQSLASPGRGTPASRVYPSKDHWNCISIVFQRFAEHFGSEELLVSLAMEKLESCPFPFADVASLKKEPIGVAAGYGYHLE